MADLNSPLLVAKQKLADALGDTFKIYQNCLKLWFRQKLTKEEFDIEARKILNADTVGLHNQFLLAFFSKCESLCGNQVNKDNFSSTRLQSREKLKKGKKKPRPIRVTFERRFLPATPSKYAPQAVAKEPQEDSRLVFCYRDHTLPDLSMIYGRMYVIAWDCGLDVVTDDAAKVLMHAVKQQLKTVLMSVVSRRKAYKLREGRFQFHTGCAPPNPYLRNSAKVSGFLNQSYAAPFLNSSDAASPGYQPTIELAETEAALELACDPGSDHILPPISTYDLLETLQVHQVTIPSHTVYAKNMERTLAMLWHPSQEELDQEHIRKQEEVIWQSLAAEQQAAVW